MKILHLSSELSWRGGEQQIAYLVSQTRFMGIDSQIVCRKNSQIAKWCKSANIPSIEINFNNAYNIFDALRVKVHFKNNNFDLLHLHSSKSHTLGVIANIIGLRAPIVLTRRVDVAIKSNWFSQYKYNYHRIKKIVCVSKEVLRVTKPRIKDERKLINIYSGVDIPSFNDIRSYDIYEQFQIPIGKKLVGNTSALTIQKDYPTFINTAEVLIRQENNFHFLIFGDGILKKEITNWINNKGLASHFTMTGFREDMADLLPQLDYFLFTSKTEGLGTSILDAFTAGVPVVATNAGGIPEIVIHRKTGLLSSIGDAVSLANNIMELENETTLKKEIIEHAKLFVKGFSKDKCAQNYINLYRAILNEQTGKA
jgi:glycosyltransferase involved in cell wall biosynthesis